MPGACFVCGCTTGRGNDNQRMHMFTPPKGDPELFAKWEMACFRKGKQLKVSSVICHKHFPEHQIIKENRILLKDGSTFTSEYSRWKLVKGAVPYILSNLAEVAPLHQEAFDSLPDISSSHYMVASTVPYADKFAESNRCDQAVQTTDKSTETVSSAMCHKATQTTDSDTRYKVLYERWQKRFRRLKKKHENPHATQSGIFIRYCNLNPRERMYANALARKGRTSKFGMRYQPRHLMEAMLIACKGRNTYNFIRDNIQMLPTLRTVQRLRRGAFSKTGLNSGALEMMKETFATLPDQQRFVVLKFDEIYLNSSVTLSDADTSHGIIGLDDTQPGRERPLLKRLQNRSMVFIAEGLSSSHSFTVANYPSAGGLSASQIYHHMNEVIREIEGSGGAVLAVVSDGAQANKSAYKSFGVTIEAGMCENYAPNPCAPHRNIYFLHDPPHLIKCIRNHFVNAKEAKFRGQPISFAYLQRVYELDMRNRLNKVCPKLTEEHMNIKNSYLKMKVSLAVQLLSNSVANGIKFYRERGDPEMQGSENTEEFVRFINDLFDCMNATHPECAVRDNGALLRVLFTSYRCLISHTVNTFASTQTMATLRLTVKSVLGICLFLLKKQGFQYVLTAKLNQDAVEGRFSAVRGRSCNDHPDVRQFADINSIQAISRPLLGILSAKSNVTMISPTTESTENINDYCERVITKLKKRCAQKDKDCAENIAVLRSKVVQNTIFTEDLGIEEARYVCKMAKCDACVALLCNNSEENLPSLLVEMKEFKPGVLTKPSGALFACLKGVDMQLQNIQKTDAIQPSLLVDLLDKIAPILSWKALFCSRQHTTDLFPLVIMHFVKMRTCHYLNCINKEVSANKKLKYAKRDCKLRI